MSGETADQLDYATSMGASGTTELTEVYSASSKEQSAEIYDKWCEKYDEQMVQHAFHGPECLVKFILKHLPNGSGKDIRILDIGAGTGRVAELLKAVGYHNVDAHDGSKGMLAKAKANNLYKNYYHEMLDETSPSTQLPRHAYDLVVGVGIFNAGHLNHNHLRHFVDAAKPGHHVMFAISNTAQIISQFKDGVNQLEQTGVFRVESIELDKDYSHFVDGMDTSASLYHIITKE